MEHPPRSTPGLLASRLTRRAAIVWRLSWKGLAVGLVGGFVMQMLLPLHQAWLPAVVAAACAGLAIVLLPVGPEPDAALPVGAQVERWSTAAQFGRAFATAAFSLGGLSVGLLVGMLAGY
jgi:hypothetical protein